MAIPSKGTPDTSPMLRDESLPKAIPSKIYIQHMELPESLSVLDTTAQNALNYLCRTHNTLQDNVVRIEAHYHKILADAIFYERYMTEAVVQLQKLRHNISQCLTEAQEAVATGNTSSTGAKIHVPRSLRPTADRE